MYDEDKTGLEFMEAFSLLAIALWVGGAALLLSLVILGNARV